MASCLDNIIGIKAPCSDDTAPISGLNITDYPGISLQSASNVVDEKLLTGYNFLVDLRRRAMIRLNTDIKSYINKEYRVNSFVSNNFQSGSFNTPASLLASGTPGQRRGLVVSSRKTHCRFYKMVISKVRIYGEYDGDIALHIVDVTAGITYTPTITLVAGTVQEYTINKPILGTEVQITIPSEVRTYSNKPDCGCGGKSKNEYLEFNGLNNATVNTSEAYGIEVDVTVKCDLTNLVCDMAHDGIIGQACYELCGAMFYDEMTKTNRLNYLTIYKGDEIKAQAQAGFAAYTNYMESALSGLRNYLVNNDGNCGCIDCGGVQISSNV